MGQQIDLYLDTGANALVAAGSVKNGVLPTLTRNDTYTLRVRLQARDSSGLLRDIDTTGASLKLGIGYLDSKPSDGQFKLTTSTGTSTAISFNATTAQVAAAIASIAGNCTVTTYGSITAGAWIITAATANTALSFGGSSFTLFPTSSVLVNTRRFPAVSVNAQQIIQLVRNPVVYSDTFSAAPTAGVVSLTKIQEGSSTQNETYRISIGPDAEGGSIVLAYGSNSTTGIAIGATAASFSEALSAVTGIGSGNISVETGNNQGDYTISFVRALGQQNVTTNLTLDLSGVLYGKFFQTSCTFSTSELDETFSEQGTSAITPKLEIELTQSGTPKTIYQGDVTIRKDLITVGSAVPAAAASFYTKAETNSLFIQNSTTGVDNESKYLWDTNSVPSVDWNGRQIYDSGFSEVIKYSSGLGFFGNAATAKPSNINVVSGLINLGLIANASTYGVLPQSVETLTLLTSVSFGTVAANDQHYRDVTVTGAAVNDIVLIGLPSAISAGAVIQGVAYKANTVCLSCVNCDNASIDVNTATYRITVIGY